VNVDQGTRSKFTSDPGADQYPIWSPDGSWIVFGRTVSVSGWPLYEKNAITRQPESLILNKPPYAKVATDWSRDGKYLLYHLFNPSGYDIWALPMEGDRTPFAVVESPGDDRDAQFSSDAKWIAYDSDESDRSEIYLQQFPKGSKVPVSKDGGTHAR